MYTITELAGHRNQPNSCQTTPRLFFSIYYQVDDNAFRRAAETWKSVVQNQERFQGGHDHFFEREVRRENEFKTAWTEIARLASDGGYDVWVGNLLTHASKQTDNNDGLEFDGGTLKEGEINALEKLPWSPHGYLVLSSCNSGLVGARSWTPAGAFAKAQGIPTLGQTGYAYFSTIWDKYGRIDDSDTRISLWAYKRSQNSDEWFKDEGPRMPGVVFK